MTEMKHQWKLMLAKVLHYYWGSEGVMTFLEINKKVWRPKKVCKDLREEIKTEVDKEPVPAIS